MMGSVRSVRNQGEGVEEQGLNCIYLFYMNVAKGATRDSSISSHYYQYYESVYS